MYNVTFKPVTPIDSIDEKQRGITEVIVCQSSSIEAALEDFRAVLGSVEIKSIEVA